MIFADLGGVECRGRGRPGGRIIRAGKWVPHHPGFVYSRPRRKPQMVLALGSMYVMFLLFYGK